MKKLRLQNVKVSYIFTSVFSSPVSMEPRCPIESSSSVEIKSTSEERTDSTNSSGSSWIGRGH